MKICFKVVSFLCRSFIKNRYILKKYKIPLHIIYKYLPQSLHLYIPPFSVHQFAPPLNLSTPNHVSLPLKTPFSMKNYFWLTFTLTNSWYPHRTSNVARNFCVILGLTLALTSFSKIEEKNGSRNRTQLTNYVCWYKCNKVILFSLEYNTNCVSKCACVWEGSTTTGLKQSLAFCGIQNKANTKQ